MGCCIQCHGSKVKVLPGGELDISTWPNTGIGRINPDGSLGSCSACHARHNFSKAREPEACGKCHLGPDHPQTEVYQESKHGILYAANKGQLAEYAQRQVGGREGLRRRSDMRHLPHGHMGATASQRATHDVGTRISWTLRPPVSIKLENADKRRENMKDICSSCHASPFVEGFYRQFDNLVVFYNEKFGKPATARRIHGRSRAL